MQVTSATADPAAAKQQQVTTPAETTNTLNYNQFLQLLIAQMKNQNPLNPTNPTEFVSQLASFSGVEQQVNTNSKLDSLLAETALNQAGSFVGKKVTSADGKVSGEVRSVKIVSGIAQATLATGEQVALTPGVSVSS